MSAEYTANVYQINLNPHPAADRLSIQQIPDTPCQVVMNTEQWSGQDRFCWVPEETLCPVDRPEFSFLASENKYDKDGNRVKNGGYALIKAKKLRGVFSLGLAVPVPPGTEIGSNMFSSLELIHYNEPEKGEVVSGQAVSGPGIVLNKYDVESINKNLREFEPYEEVVATLKAHGSNMRVVYKNDQMYVGSRTTWKAREEKHDLESIRLSMTKGGKTTEEIETRINDLKNRPTKISHFWVAAESDPRVFEFCRSNPETVVYGECVGSGVQGGEFRYHAGSSFKMWVFDVFKDGKWFNYDDLRSLDLPHIPELYRGPFDFDKLKNLVEEKCEWNNGGIREGVVVKPKEERLTNRGERVCYKIVSQAYLLK